jgi:hypothetical protein
METPQPVDLNRLKGILGASKAIMKKVESGNFETGHVDARALTEDGVSQLQSEGASRPTSQNAPAQYTNEMVMNSNLPPAIKKAMLERPIPQLSGPSYTFSLDDVSDLQEEKKMGLPKTPKTKILSESSGNKSDSISVTKEELKEMVNELVNEKLLEFFIKNNNKTIAENAVKKTITTLINEGKIITKRK